MKIKYYYYENITITQYKSKTLTLWIPEQHVSGCSPACNHLKHIYETNDIKKD